VDTPQAKAVMRSWDRSLWRTCVVEASPLKPPMVGNLWEVRDSAMDAGMAPEMLSRAWQEHPARAIGFLSDELHGSSMSVLVLGLGWVPGSLGLLGPGVGCSGALGALSFPSPYKACCRILVPLLGRGAVSTVAALVPP